jgi:hypothetical protein
VTAAWNLLVYAVAGDDAELERVAHAIDDMHGALTTGPCNVAVQLHTKSTTTRHWISAKHKLRKDVLADGVLACEPSSLTGFLDAAHREFPDRPTALTLWAHSNGLDYVHNYHKAKPDHAPGLDSVFGRGGRVLGGDDSGAALGAALAGRVLAPGAPSIGGGTQRALPRRPERYGCRWGPDPVSGDYLTNVGMRGAIARSAQRRVEVLGLNACGMASLEVEYELRSVSDVQIACQVDAVPWPYGSILTGLIAKPSQTTDRVARMIVEHVRAGIANNQREDALSAVHSGAALTELASAVGDYARRVLPLVDSQWDAVLKAVTKQAWRVDDPYEVDLISLVGVLGVGDPRAELAATAVRKKFDAALIDNTSARPHTHGLSLFCPKDTLVDLSDAYKGTQFRDNPWRQFLRAFQTKLARRASA